MECVLGHFGGALGGHCTSRTSVTSGSLSEPRQTWRCLGVGAGTRLLYRAAITYIYSRLFEVRIFRFWPSNVHFLCSVTTSVREVEGLAVDCVTTPCQPLLIEFAQTPKRQVLPTCGPLLDICRARPGRRVGNDLLDCIGCHRSHVE